MQIFSRWWIWNLSQSYIIDDGIPQNARAQRTIFYVCPLISSPYQLLLRLPHCSWQQQQQHRQRRYYKRQIYRNNHEQWGWDGQHLWLVQIKCIYTATEPGCVVYRLLFIIVCFCCFCPEISCLTYCYMKSKPSKQTSKTHQKIYLLCIVIYTYCVCVCVC